MSGIKPKWTVILGIAVTVEQAIGTGVIKLTNMIPVDYIPAVISWNQALAFVGTTIMTTMAAYSSQDTGPMINKQ